MICLIIQACSSGGSVGLSKEVLSSPAGFLQWQQNEILLKKSVQDHLRSYQREQSLEVLQEYEGAVRAYLDHGFELYRAYEKTHKPLPSDLIPSLESRTDLLMDVADEYIKHGSLALGEGIADDMVHDYSDLPAMARAQRRAEALLMRYRYRQDY